ncbi:MAG TPA: sugar transferase [Chthonomonadaceae bacterium]|nr:sugar transferase [Chthonomonadaceae bacterium]
MHPIGDEACPTPPRGKAIRKTALAGLAFASRLLALIVIVLYLPALLAAGLLVVLTSPGPPLVRKAYRRTRRKDQVVYLYEFRTECWQTWNETPVGRLLRLCDMHRIPRLANVLMGDVGAGERVEALRA